MDDGSSVCLRPFVMLVIDLNFIYNALGLSRKWRSIVHLWNNNQRTWAHAILKIVNVFQSG